MLITGLIKISPTRGQPEGAKVKTMLGYFQVQLSQNPQDLFEIL